MTIRLRPHHLLCLLTYAGKGYSSAFTANMTVIAGRISGGETIEIVEGPDDICAPLMGESDPHCHRASVSLRDRRAAGEAGPLIGRPIGPGLHLTLGEAERVLLRHAFAHGRIRGACSLCQWHELCSDTAAAGFGGTKLAS